MKHKHAELIHAWAEGAKVQVLVHGSWEDIKYPSWFVDEDYRIKHKTPE